jgi:hypothetical protein
VDLRVPASQSGAVAVSLAVEGVPVRDANLTIWVH